MRNRPARRAAVRLAVVVLVGGAVGLGWATPLQRAWPVSAAVGLPRPAPRGTGTPMRATSAAAGPAVRSGAVDAEIAGLAGGRPADSVSVAAVDATTGVRYDWGPSSGMTAASVAKLLLLESSLLQQQDRGESAGGGEVDALTSMIEHSDNDAADAVYAAQGGSGGLRQVMPRLGLSSTVLGADDQWGLSTTGAADQLALLHNLVSAGGPLSAASRAFALRLMGDVEADQRWGVGAAADPSTDFANKNGWLPVDDDGGRWAVNSVGIITVHGHQVLLAVLTQHDDSFDDGIGLVGNLARAAITAVADAPGPGPARG